MSKLHIARLNAYTLCTYEILYWLPDRPTLLGPAFILQELDLAPEYPVLNKFLGFWKHNIEARIHSVRVASQQLIKPTEVRLVGTEFYLN
jgi:uncharacterized protein Usg